MKTYIKKNKFKPSFIIRNTYVQSILGSSKITLLGKKPDMLNPEEKVINVGKGVRLQGYHIPHGNSRGLVILLNGWEGGFDSSYIQRTCLFLYKQGFSLFHLNLRDHGNSHYLNEGLFLGTLIDETFAGVKKASELSEGLPIALIAFSLGGNFGLRIARMHSKKKISGLSHVVCISPPLDPAKSTHAIDKNEIFRKYFINKYKNSLRKKQELFPNKYHIDDVLQMQSCFKITEELIKRYTKYTDVYTYFKEYTLLGDALLDIKIPTTIFISRDDPIIPVDDFLNLNENPNIDIRIQPYGGHNGFIHGFNLRGWYEAKIAELLEVNGKIISYQSMSKA